MQALGTLGTTVAIVFWPREAERRAVLVEQCLPRLLILDEGGDPPLDIRPDEDWVRLPSAGNEIEMRLAILAARSRSNSPPPTLDEDGVLRTPTGWLSLPSRDSRLLRVLIAHWGRTAGNKELGTALRPDLDDPDAVSRDLRTQIHRLRRRLAEVGLEINLARGVGYCLEYQKT